MPNDARTTASEVLRFLVSAAVVVGLGTAQDAAFDIANSTNSTNFTNCSEIFNWSGTNCTFVSNGTGIPWWHGPPAPVGTLVQKPHPGRRPHPDVIDDPRTLSPDVFPGHSLAHDGLPHGSRPAPVLLKLWPRSGPVEGGTELTIRGSGFARTGRETCRFSWLIGAGAGEPHVVPARTVSPTEMRCETPHRGSPGVAVLTVSADGARYSGEAAMTVSGSGSFAFFNYTSVVPAGFFILDNRTGPYRGETEISITINSVKPDDSTETTFIPYDETVRVSWDDPGVELSADGETATYDNATYDVLNSSGHGAYIEVLRSGIMSFDTEYKDTKPVLRQPFEPSKLARCKFDFNVTRLNETRREALAAVNASFSNATVLNMSVLYDNIGGTWRGDCERDCPLTRFPNDTWSGQCFFPNATNATSNETLADSSLLSGGANMINATNASNVTYINCSFVPFVPIETATTPLTWMGYNRARCDSPQQTMPIGNTTGPGGVALTHTMEVRVSNNGQDFTKLPIGNFTYVHAPPDVFHVYTLQVAGKHKARGPFSGNTEVYINGTGFLPSPHLAARFYTLEINELNIYRVDEIEFIVYKVDETKASPACSFDTLEQIRCLSPPFYPYDDYAERQQGGLKPCFRTYVEVSNDRGTTWSGIDTRNSFVYCPVYVSSYGSNGWGDGTPSLPYRDLSRAIQGALSEPRSYWIRKGKRVDGSELAGRQQRGLDPRGRGVNSYINHDQIVVMDGIYTDFKGVFGPERNLNLDPGGRVIEIVADKPGYAFVDCEGGLIDATRPFGPTDRHEFDVEQHGALFFKDVGLVGCAGYARWEHYDANPAATTEPEPERADDEVAEGDASYGARRLLAVDANEGKPATGAKETGADAEAELVRRKSLLEREAGVASMDAARVQDTSLGTPTRPGRRRHSYQGSRA